MSQKGHRHAGSTAQNQKAHLASAYNELGKELSSTKLRVVGNYTLGKVIGEGTYGKVRIGVHRLTGTRVAIKQIPKVMGASLTREIHHHRRLHHPHVTQLYEVIATESHIWLVSELCSGGELFDYLAEKGRLSEPETRIIFGQLCLAVAYIHDTGTVHRDLKLENVLLDERCRVKLGDFGFTREYDAGVMLDTFCGTTGYAAPEVLEAKKYSGPETDVWSLGIILYCLLTGSLPFDDDDEDTMRKKILSGDYEEPDWLSRDSLDLIRNLLVVDPSKRFAIPQILSHSWFTRPSSPRSRPSSAYFATIPQIPEQPESVSAASTPSEATTFHTASSQPTTPERTNIEIPPVPRNPSESTLKNEQDRQNTYRASFDQSLPDEDSSFTIPPPSRTPARTKRRSVASALSIPPSPTLAVRAPANYASLLATPAPVIFSTPVEKQLLNSLSSIGFDTAQMVHSVLSDACDSSGAIWWMMKRNAEKKALEAESGEKDDIVEATPIEPLQPEIDEPASPIAVFPTSSTFSITSTELSLPAPNLALSPPTPTIISEFSPQPPSTPHRSKSLLSPSNSATPSRSQPGTPGSGFKEGKDKGKAERPNGKPRSGSVSIMQRATTALEAAGLVRKKSDERVRTAEQAPPPDKEKQRTSSTDDAPRSSATSSRLTKSPPPRAKELVTPSTPSIESELGPSSGGVVAGSVGSPWIITTAVRSSSPAGEGEKPPSPTATRSPPDTLTSLPGERAQGNNKNRHGRNRSSLLHAFRMWFNEDKKGKRKVPSSPPATTSPTGHYIPHHVVRGSSSGSVRGRRRSGGSIHASASHSNHRAKRPSVSSRRSSSVNSRRSSITSVQMIITDFQESSVPITRQRSDASRHSYGDRTPISDRGGELSSRPSSVRSFVVSGASTSKPRKKPSKSSSASSIGSRRAMSPMRRVHTRAGSGSSTRVVRQPNPTSSSSSRVLTHLRSSSATSSVHSLPPSRPNSFYGDISDGDIARANSPYRPRRSLEESSSTPRRGAQQLPLAPTVLVAQKRRTPFMGPINTRNSWRKAWGTEPPGWSERHRRSQQHGSIEILALETVDESETGVFRDVFSGRHSLNLDDDSDWVDEDDEMQALQGGLGQTKTRAGAGQVLTVSTPSLEAPFASRRNIESLSAPPRSSSSRWSERKRSAVGNITTSGGASSRKGGHSPVQGSAQIPEINNPAMEGRQGRRGPLPNTRSGPLPIQEEDEEEEEEE